LTKSKGKPRTNTNKHQKKHQKAMENPENHEKSSKISDFTMFFARTNLCPNITSRCDTTS